MNQSKQSQQSMQRSKGKEVYAICLLVALVPLLALVVSAVEIPLESLTPARITSSVGFPAAMAAKATLTAASLLLLNSSSGN